MIERKKKKRLRIYPGPAAKDFRPPSDVSAAEVLKQVPARDKPIAKVMESSLKRIFYRNNSASSKRATLNPFGRWQRDGYQQFEHWPVNRAA
ncbi:MAG TPA: hypothetical protein VFZ34_12335 [Blastocatellia bacterium]|nr:hypothetical protein [Blastocatellia bacterium]